MASSVTVVVNEPTDVAVIKAIAECLRANDSYSRQIRDFADCLENEQRVRGIVFQPHPGQILACHFGLGFRVPEMVKTRPVMVISPKVSSWTGLCVVLPISSTPPDPVQSYHYKLPDGIVPGDKYEEAWIKGDTLMAVSRFRLDRLKVKPRQYEAPIVQPDVLQEARRCVLHATGMHSLTVHW